MMVTGFDFAQFVIKQWMVFIVTGLYPSINLKCIINSTKDTLSFLVTIKDRVNASGGDSEHDNLVQVPIKVIVLDENDVVPEFQNVPYETEVLESATPGTRIFNSILVMDKDTVGENLNITCLTAPQKILIKSPQSASTVPSRAATDSYEQCSKFAIELIESNQDRLKAAIILKEKLDYNEQMIYHLILTATDGIHSASTGVEIRVKDVQNRPPVFQGSLAAVINEDSPIGTLVMTIQAKDGDHGQPRKIIYDLLTNPMDYFLLNAKTGELHTARPLDREALADATGIIVLTVRARELVDGQPSNDNSTVAITQASITIHDVNDSPPVFNKKNYFISLAENTPIGTPLPIEINVRDPDVGQNSLFSLRLEDVSGVFDVEPKFVTGSSPVSIRIANGILDYENPNQRKFIVLIIAEETETVQKLSSTATLTVTVTDANDNRPIFEQESYSFAVSETAPVNHLIGTITAKDLDSAQFGTNGIRYSLSGAGSELFRVSNNGAITVAECQNPQNGHNTEKELHRKKREINKPLTNAKKVNLTIVGETGVIDVDDDATSSTTELYYPYGNVEEVTFRPFFSVNDDYMVMSDDSDEETTTTTVAASETMHEIDENHSNELNRIDAQHSRKTIKQNSTSTTAHEINVGAGHAPCLDYETQPVYFLTYKATDDNGLGQTSVVSLRITLTDSNDSPPVCESALYRASLDEGAIFFDPPLFIKVRDADSISDISFRIRGNDNVLDLFTIDKHTGQLFIKDTVALDVNHLNSENIFFSVEADDGVYSTVCHVNITIRDVNNHAPKFVRDNYMATIAENTAIGTIVERVEATDLDTGINAKIRYRIQQGSFDDFTIDNQTGLISIARKLDYDKRENYRIEVVASDLGIPSLSGTATVSINLINSNDKDPFFIPATQRAEVREDAPIGKRIYQLVAHDPDVASNDVLTYEVTEPITAVNKNGKEVTDSQTFKHLFAVDRYGNVTVNGLLDRDFFAVVRLTVVVTDITAPELQQGKGILIITIIEVNEMPPVFALPWTPSTPKLIYQMLEEQPIGTKLTQLQATDSDSNIEAYHLSANDYLEINNLTGIITTKARIDYESIKQIYVNAYVTDTGLPQLTSTAEIIVDIVNANDNEPHFSLPEYRFTVAENSPKGTYIGEINAKDNDDGIFGNVTYSLIGDHSNNFNVDSISGAITVQNSSFLDRERLPEVSFSAVAIDKAPITTRHSTHVPIYITVQDMNDNSPVFTQKSYYASVAENAQLNPPAAVLQVNAVDADDGIFGEVKYAVVGNDNMMFQLDPNSGILYPSQSLKGKTGQYKLTVEGRDGLGFGPNADKADVVIDVQTVNNYRPIFIMPALSNASVEIQENHATSNYLVMTVKASDEDTGDNGLVKYYLQVNNQNVLETDEFKIDEHTGELALKKDLNREKQSKYELVLVARDQGTPSYFESLRFLTILIVSVNENKAEFPDASNPYKFFVVENSDRGIRIGKIQAYLRDKDPHTHVYYYMLLGNENGAFYVDKKTGDVFTNRSLDREEVDTYHLYILSSKKSDLHISRRQRDELSIEQLERDSTVAKVQVKVNDLNDNAPKFEHDVYYAGISAEAAINHLVTTINATDADMGTNGTFDLIIVASNLYKYGSSRSVGSIVPSPFKISKDGRLTTAAFMGEYDQDRFELTIVAKEIEHPGREASTKVVIWVIRQEQLVRVIMSRPPTEVMMEREELVSELRNATDKRIVVDEIRHHVNSMGRIRMDWCDMYFHAVEPDTSLIVPVDDVLKGIDNNYDFLKDYYAGFAIENIIPAHAKFVEEEIDLALVGLLALLVVLFIGAISFMVLCCCLKNWNMNIPPQTRRKEALIKKQFIDELSTTENPLWIEQKMKMYEEQELTMQVFSEPEIATNESDGIQPASPFGRRDSYEVSQMGDNTYATIQPRHATHSTGNSTGPRLRNSSSVSTIGNGEIADYATLRNVTSVHPPSTTPHYEFTGSTFQALSHNDDGTYVAEII